MPTEVICVVWGEKQRFCALDCYIAGAVGEGEGLVPLSACKALKCNSLEESHHHQRQNFFHRRKNTLREVVQIVVCAAVFK